MSGDLSDPKRFLFTICFVFLGDLAASSFFLLDMDTILPVVTRAPLFFTLLLAERSIWRDVRLVSKLFGRLRKDLDRLTLLLGLLGRMAGAGGCMEPAETGPRRKPTQISVVVASRMALWTALQILAAQL